MSTPCPHVAIDTSVGSLTVKLYEEAAPNVCGAFLAAVASGAYVGTSFHRVWNTFCVQGGRPLAGHAAAAAVTMDAPTAFQHVHGALGAVRSNTSPTHATGEFCVFHRPDGAGSCEWLDGKQVVFGQLVEGWDVLDAIANGATETRADHFGGDENTAPLEPVLIRGMTRTM